MDKTQTEREFTLDPSRLNHEERCLFLAGIIDACGKSQNLILGEYCPWNTKEMIKVKGVDPSRWGAQYWKQIQAKKEQNSIEVLPYGRAA